MSVHGKYDHELKIGSTTHQLEVIRDKGKAIYSVTEEVPSFDPQIKLVQDMWDGGHGQHDFIVPDMYFEGRSIDTTQDGRLFLGPLITEVLENDDTELIGTPRAFLWFSKTSEWLCGAGQDIYRYDVGGNGKWLDGAASSAVAVSDLVEYNQVAYAAHNGSAYYTSTDGINWSPSDPLLGINDNLAEKFLVSPNEAGTENVIWKSREPNELTNTNNGQQYGTQWSSPAYIGDTSNNITNIFYVNDKLMVGREDGLYHYDHEGGIHALLAELIQHRSARNFQYITNWRTGAYFSVGDSVGEITSYDSYDVMGPLDGIDDINKAGRVIGLAADKDFIYVAMNEGTDGSPDNVIYKGREKLRRGELRWEWCPWVYLGANACSTIAICQHSATDRRLWFGYGNHTAYVKLFDDPTADASARFAPTGWVRMSYHYGTNRLWDKMIQSVVTETVGCEANITVRPSYRKDTEANFSWLTPAIATNGTVKTALSSALSYKRIHFELHLATNDSSKTPEISYFEVRGTEKPETVRMHEVTYYAGSNPHQLSKSIRSFLREGRTSTTLIKFADLRYGQKTSGSSSGDYVWVVMVPGYPQEVELFGTRDRLPEMGIRCKFMEVDFTIS